MSAAIRQPLGGAPEAAGVSNTTTVSATQLAGPLTSGDTSSGSSASRVRARGSAGWLWQSLRCHGRGFADSAPATLPPMGP